MSLQTYIDLGSEDEIQSAITDMENARDRTQELFNWLMERINLASGAPQTNAQDAFADMMAAVDQVHADIELQIERAKEALSYTPEAKAEAQQDRDAQNRAVM